MAQLRLAGSKIDAGGAPFGSEDVRFKKGTSTSVSKVNLLAERPIEEVQARLGSKKMGPLMRWLLQYHMQPVASSDERAWMTMARRTSTSDINSNMYCSSCKAYHTRAIPEQLGIIIGDSQCSNLNLGADGRQKADNHHVDHYIRPGHNLDQLNAGLAYFYSHVESSLRVCVVGGYINFLRGQTRQEIIDAFGRFKQLLEEMDALHGRPFNSSNIVCSTLIMAPALVMRLGDKLDRSKEHFNEEGRRLQKLNAQILQLNSTNGWGEQSTPMCESIGRRSSWKNNRKRFSFQNNWFREPKREDMLHLSNRYKYLLHKKLHRTLKRMVSTSSLVKLPCTSKYSKKFELVKSLKDLTIDGKASLKDSTKSSTSSTKKSSTPKKKPAPDDTMEQEMARMTLSTESKKGNEITNSSYTHRGTGESRIRSKAVTIRGESILPRKGSSDGQKTKVHREQKKTPTKPGKRSSRSPPVTRGRLSSDAKHDGQSHKKTKAGQKRQELFNYVRGRLEEAYLSGSAAIVKYNKRTPS